MLDRGIEKFNVASFSADVPLLDGAVNSLGIDCSNGTSAAPTGEVIAVDGDDGYTKAGSGTEMLAVSSVMGCSESGLGVRVLALLRRLADARSAPQKSALLAPADLGVVGDD